MKKFKILLLFTVIISVLLIMSACADNSDTNSDEPITPAGSESDADNNTEYTSDDVVENSSGNNADTGSVPDIVIPGRFVEYRNDQYGFSVHHPSEWIALDQSVSMEEIIDFLEDEFGDENHAMINTLGGANLDGVTVMWYDFDNMVGDIAPNTNIVASSSMGLTQSDLKSPESKAEMQAIFESMFSQLFDGFSPVSDLTGRYLGDNYYVLFQFDASPMGVSMSFYQAMTIIDGQMYTFTHTTEGGRLGFTSNAFEQMLSTLTTS